MNSRYCGKAWIKLLSISNSVYNFKKNGSETEKSGIKASMLAGDHMVTEVVPSNGNGLNTYWHVSSHDMLTRQYKSTQGIFTCEVPKHSRQVST